METGGCLWGESKMALHVLTWCLSCTLWSTLLYFVVGLALKSSLPLWPSSKRDFCAFHLQHALRWDTAMINILLLQRAFLPLVHISPKSHISSIFFFHYTFRSFNYPHGFSFLSDAISGIHCYLSDGSCSSSLSWQQQLISLREGTSPFCSQN